MTASSRSAWYGANSNCVPVQTFALNALAAMLSVLCSRGMAVPHHVRLDHRHAVAFVCFEFVLQAHQVLQLVRCRVIPAVVALPAAVRLFREFDDRMRDPLAHQRFDAGRTNGFRQHGTSSIDLDLEDACRPGVATSSPCENRAAPSR